MKFNIWCSEHWTSKQVHRTDTCVKIVDGPPHSTQWFQTSVHRANLAVLVQRTEPVKFVSRLGCDEAIMISSKFSEIAC